MNEPFGLIYTQNSRNRDSHKSTSLILTWTEQKFDDAGIGISNSSLLITAKRKLIVSTILKALEEVQMIAWLVIIVKSSRFHQREKVPKVYPEIDSLVLTRSDFQSQSTARSHHHCWKVG